MLKSEDPTGVRKGTATQEEKADGSQLVNRAVSLHSYMCMSCEIDMPRLLCQLAGIASLVINLVLK